MTKIKDGGPAFPYEGYALSKTSGMSLRDYFAAKAMQAFLNNVTAIKVAQKLADKEQKGAQEVIATHSYGVADAMLHEREKGEETE